MAVPSRRATVLRLRSFVDVPRAPNSMRRLSSVPVAHTLRALTFLIGMAGAPSLLHAQLPSDSAATPKPGTVLHVVKTGDTLYDIARRYLGNPFRWPELFRANAGQIANANLIYPGQRLVAGADGRPTFAPDGPIDATAPEVPPARTVMLGRATTAQRMSTLENATLNGRALRPTVRRGEAAAAPFLAPKRKPSRDDGSLAARAEPTVVVAGSTSRDQFQIFDEVNVLLPARTRATVGQRFGVFQLGPEVHGDRQDGQIVRPAGAIEIVALGTGRAARARVTALYANMQRGDLLLPLEPLAEPSTVRPEGVVNGPVYDVAYVEGGVVLPTVQNYVVIALPKGASAKVGDQFTLFTKSAPLTDGQRDVPPPNEVADVSVVRVTAEGATAVVVGHRQPAIQVGMQARLVGRMP